MKRVSIVWFSFLRVFILVSTKTLYLHFFLLLKWLFHRSERANYEPWHARYAWSKAVCAQVDPLVFECVEMCLTSRLLCLGSVSGAKKNGMNGSDSTDARAATRPLPLPLPPNMVRLRGSAASQEQTFTSPILRLGQWSRFRKGVLNRQSKAGFPLHGSSGTISLFYFIFCSPVSQLGYESWALIAPLRVRGRPSPIVDTNLTCIRYVPMRVQHKHAWA